MLASERARDRAGHRRREGATLREMLRYPSIRRAVMVDIDDEVGALCKKHLPEMHQARSRTPARGSATRTPGRTWKNVRALRFHHIDLVEPLEEGPACLLFTKEFYTLVRDRLTPGGALSLQAGMTKLGELDFFSCHQTAPARGVPGGRRLPDPSVLLRTPWGSSPRPRRSIRPPGRRHRRPAHRRAGEGPMGYWDGQTHSTRFHLPKHIRAAIDAHTRVVTDAHR